MLQYAARIFCLCALILTAHWAIGQTEFSADVVNHKQSGSTVEMKLYFGKDKARFESVDRTKEDQGIGIMNFKTQTVTVLLKQRQMYIELPAAQSPAQRDLYNFFRAGDVENACGDWQRIANNQGGTCHKVGDETVNGRATVKYEGANSKGDRGYFWIDAQLRLPVKWQDNKSDSSGELRNIKEGAQPESLFEVPAGYTKFDMGAMRQQR
jgi:hypothetical protein